MHQVCVVLGLLAKKKKKKLEGLVPKTLAHGGTFRVPHLPSKVPDSGRSLPTLATIPQHV